MSPRPDGERSAVIGGTFKDTGLRAWILNPHPYHTVCQSVKCRSDFMSKVPRPIMSFPSRKRTTKTSPTLRDGKVAFPGSDIPPVQIRTDELDFPLAWSTVDFSTTYWLALGTPVTLVIGTPTKSAVIAVTSTCPRIAKR